MHFKFNTIEPKKVSKSSSGLPLVLVLSWSNTATIAEQLPDGVDLDTVNTIIANAIVGAKEDAVFSFTYDNLTQVANLPKKLGVVVIPYEKKDIISYRKNVTKGATTAASLVKAFAAKNDVNLQVDFASSFETASAPSVIREISNALYDYKDDRTAPKRVISVLTSSVGSLTVEEAFDIKLHEHMTYVRDLVTAPPNVMTPWEIKQEAIRIAGKSNKIKVVNHNPEKEKMGGLLGVSRGSAIAPEFVEMQYLGSKNKRIDYVLIGKGITFDSGGYSIKPAKSMEDMKGDMAGAATVLGVFSWLAANGADKNIVGLIPTCENMVDAAAIVPGEVITYANGKTVEVLNTDAEGRLILADALIYSQKFEGAKVIDIATLTGGIVVGLGKYRTGLFGNDDELIEDIKYMGDHCADPVWHMPMDPEVYEPKSNVADLPNISPGPSSITAAMFLREFAPENWAHLDIAGTSGDAVGTGRPLPLLVGLISN